MERIIVRCRDCGMSKRIIAENYRAVSNAHTAANEGHTTYLVSYETGQEL